MLTPSLQLERSFFADVQIKANPKHVLGQGEVEVKATQTLGRATQDGLRWVVELDLTVAGKENATSPPYNIHLHSVGIFQFAGPDLSDAQKAHLLAVTGASILYSQAREYLLMLTARGPWGSFQLPTVSFADSSPRLHGNANQRARPSTMPHRPPVSTTRRKHPVKIATGRAGTGR